MISSEPDQLFEDHRYRSDESVFVRAGRLTRDIVRESPFADFAADSFYLYCYLDTIPCLERCIPINEAPDCHDLICPVNDWGMRNECDQHGADRRGHDHQPSLG
ncbi:MAG: hypothetical protein R3E12_06170 [Candidatus Eisenbacteria bacterium]